MANYREILRLHSLGISNKQVSAACHCSRTTVIDVLKRATEISLEWGSAKDLSDKEITDRLFPPGLQKPCYKMPDYSQIHKEMGKNGVTLSLLWAEYCSQCRETGELPYQSTQFNKYYRDYAKRVFLEPPDRSTESHWRAEIRAGGAGPRAIEANTNIKSHLS